MDIFLINNQKEALQPREQQVQPQTFKKLEKQAQKEIPKRTLPWGQKQTNKQKKKMTYLRGALCWGQEKINTRYKIYPCKEV